MICAAEHVTPSSLAFPQDRENNFWYVRTGSDTVIVFLHGIFSSSKTCWLYKGPEAESPVFWPDLVRSDARLGSASIYLAGYYTALDAGDFPITQCARQVLEALDRREADGTPPVLDSPSIVFVCHSTGGIVIRYLLERNKELFRGKAVGLALMASPSLGSRWSNFAAFAARYYNQTLGLQLRWNGESLADLHDRFRSLVEDRRREMPGLFGMEAAESKMIFRDTIPSFIRWAVPNRLKVVTTISAAQYFKDFMVLPDTDHFSIVKPYGTTHPAHDFLVGFMKRFMDPKSEHQELLAERRAPRSTPQASGSDALAAVAAEPRTVSATGVTAASSGIAAASIGQVTQIIISAPTQSLPAQVAATLPKNSLEIPWTLLQPVLAREAAPKPSLDELFEIITDPDAVAKALFGTDSAPGLAPYEVQYVKSRENLADTTGSLKLALLQNKRRLLVSALRGIGKTRELAELARAECAAGWTVLVARNEAKDRLGEAATLPKPLIDGKVLLLLDNLHDLVLPAADGNVPYVTRLNSLLAWVEQRLPGSVRVIATTRAEPLFSARLSLADDATQWNGFGVFRLPTVDELGLQQILTWLAARAKVPLGQDDVPKLIENSDHKPGTLFINVDRARRTKVTLSPQEWKPTEGETWRLRFVSARAEEPGVDRVCNVLYLLRQIGLPARVPYVRFIAEQLNETRAAQAVNALVGEGLLGLRDGVLSPFSNDQLKEFVGEQDVLKDEATNTALVERAIAASSVAPPMQVKDLLALASHLAQRRDLEQAEAVATRAIALDPDEVLSYRVRSFTRFSSMNFAGAESDLTTVLAKGGDPAETYFMRGIIRTFLANPAEGLEDLVLAMKAGRDDAGLHLQLGTAYYQLKRFDPADAHFTAAIERGQMEGIIFYMRGAARLSFAKFDGAEADFTEALTRGVDFLTVERQLRVLNGEAASSLEPPVAASLSHDSAMVLGMRGLARARQGKSALAEEDLSAALTAFDSDPFMSYLAVLKQSRVPMIAGALTQLSPETFSKSIIYDLRGFTRIDQKLFAGAEQDFDAAIAGGFSDAEAYFGRGWARGAQGKAAEAKEDLTIAIDRGRADALVYFFRGSARFDLQDMLGAEQDLTQAIELGDSSAPSPVALQLRGKARTLQGKLQEAEQDFTDSLAGAPNADIFFARGCVRFDLQDFQGANQDFTEARSSGFDSEPLLALRGAARLILGDVAGAEQDATEAFERGGETLQTFSIRGAVRLAQERFDEAEKDLTRALELGRDDAWLHTQRGQARKALQQYSAAEADFDWVLDRDPTNVDALVARGEMRLRQEKPEAEADFAAAVAAGRDDGQLHFFLARAYQAQKRYRNAGREFDAALAREDRPLFYFGRGMLRLTLGDFPGAEADFGAHIAALPGSPEISAVFNLRAMARYGRGDLAGALADFDEVLTRSPDDKDALEGRAIVNVRRGELEAAAQDQARLAALAPDGALTLGTQGVMQLARGDGNEAARTLAAAATRDDRWNTWLGLAHLKGGRPAEALRAYKDWLLSAVPGDLLIAISELDWQTKAREREGHPPTPEAREAAARIRSELRDKLPADN